jgi:hypothetical protein
VLTPGDSHQPPVRATPFPAWLRAAHPFLQVLYFEWSNRLRRAGPGMLLGGLSVTTASFVLCSVRLVPGLLLAAGNHALTATMLIAVCAAIATHRGRSRWTQVYSRGWQAVWPVSRASSTAFIALRSFSWPLLVLIVLLASVLLAGWSARSRPEAAMGALMVGTLLGLAIGWWLPRDYRDSRRTAAAGTLASAQRATRLSGLSAWPITQARVWLHPRAIARLFALVLVLPLETPGNVALALWTALLIVVYLLLLLIATLKIARQSAAWLRPTPIPFARYARSVGWLSLLKQLQWTVTAVVLLSALGVQPMTALRIAEVWLAISSVLMSTALVCAFKGSRPSIRMLMALVGVSAAEYLREYLALPCALIVSGWQLRQAARS